MKNLVCIFAVLTITTAMSQQEQTLPYYELPEYSENYTAGTVLARQIDGLGFRYYWASADLTNSDLDYRLNEVGRSTLETLEHIYDLSTVIRDAALQVPHIKETLKRALTYNELRSQTLNNLKTASDIFKMKDNLENFDMQFNTPDGIKVIPLWNLINGPVSDAIWHCGQVAAYRRASGHPINAYVNHFMGTVKKS